MSDPIKIKFGKPGVLPTEPGRYICRGKCRCQDKYEYKIIIVRPGMDINIFRRWPEWSQPLTFEDAEL